MPPVGASATPRIRLLEVSLTYATAPEASETIPWGDENKAEKGVDEPSA